MASALGSMFRRASNALPVQLQYKAADEGVHDEAPEDETDPVVVARRYSRAGAAHLRAGAGKSASGAFYSQASIRHQILRRRTSSIDQTIEFKAELATKLVALTSEREIRTNYVVLPEDPRLYYWDTFLALIISYNVVVVPCE